MPPKPTLAKHAGATPASRSGLEALSRVTRDLKEGERVVLYRSGKHGAFYLFAYSIGGSFILGISLWTSMVLKEKEGGAKLSYLMRAALMFEAFCVVMIGTVFMLAPSNLVKRASIVKQAATAANGQSPLLFEFTIKRRLPFLKPDVLETSLENVTISPAVPGQKLSYRSIPLEQMNEFNQDTWRPPAGDASSFYRSLRGVASGFVRNTKRCFMRDQMVFVTVKGVGRIKLDLHGGSLLDNGHQLRPFMRAGAPGSLLGKLVVYVSRFGSPKKTS
jgi:hypothetical protein